MPEIEEFRCYAAKIKEYRCATEAFGTTYAVHLENCEDQWLSGCRGSVAEHFKPVMFWVQHPATDGIFHFPLFSPHNI